MKNKITNYLEEKRIDKSLILILIIVSLIELGAWALLLIKIL